MRSLLLRWLCGLCFLGVSDVFAVDYYWVRSGKTTQYPSPQKVCDAYRSSYTPCMGNYSACFGDTSTTMAAERIDDATFRCQSYSQPSGMKQGYFLALRSGDTCPGGGLYDPSTGQCSEPPPPPPTPDQCLASGPGIFSKTGPIINSNGANYVATQGGGSVCYNQCSHSLANSAASCYSSGEGSSSGFCNYIGTPTGEICSEPDAPLGTTGAPLNPPDTDPSLPPSDPNDPGCPSGYGWSGTTCAKLPPPDGGDTGGGDTGGGGSGGGGGDTGGGDTGGGDTGGGDDGGGDGSGGETGGGLPGGGGSGDGSGDEREDPESSVGGESCSATITCEGDAIQCAILRSQKKQACADEEARDYSKAAPTINAEIAKGEYQLKEETVDASGFFNLGNRFYSSTCPAPKSLRIESFNRTIQLSYQPLCDFAGALSYIVVAMASLFFMVYVGRSFGGE